MALSYILDKRSAFLLYHVDSRLREGFRLIELPVHARSSARLIVPYSTFQLLFPVHRFPHLWKFFQERKISSLAPFPLSL